MPSGIYKHKPFSEEVKRKIGLSRKGKPFSGKRFNWKGKKLRAIHKNKISLGLTGKILSKETREKLSESRKGKNGSNWKGGITSENHGIRNGIEIRLWREAVFARDNWTCQKTGIKGGKLVAHHIKNFAQYPELRFAIDNGITLSKQVHLEFHKIYGQTNNTKEQLEDFLIRELKIDVQVSQLSK